MAAAGQGIRVAKDGYDGVVTLLRVKTREKVSTKPIMSALENEGKGSMVVEENEEQTRVSIIAKMIKEERRMMQEERRRMQEERKMMERMEEMLTELSLAKTVDKQNEPSSLGAIKKEKTALARVDEPSENAPQSEVAEEKIRNIYVPLKVKEVHAKLQEKKELHGKYLLRSLSSGRTTITAKDKVSYELIKSVFSSGDGFFEFRNKKEMPFKAVLFGLSKYDEADVMKFMMDCDELKVKPTFVVRMKKGNNGAKQNTAFFTVTFPAGTTMQDLEQVKAINNTRGGFGPLSRIKGQRTCCGNCQSWDHFELGCKMRSKCRKCGGNHHSRMCDVVKPEDPMTALTCANCGENHPASFTGCRVAKEFMARQKPKEKKETQEEPGDFEPQVKKQQQKPQSSTSQISVQKDESQKKKQEQQQQSLVDISERLDKFEKEQEYYKKEQENYKKEEERRWDLLEVILQRLLTARNEN